MAEWQDIACVYLGHSCQVTPSRHMWVVDLPVSFWCQAWARHAPATDVFVFELAISDVGQECQLGACVPTQTSLWIFPSMLGKQS